MKSSCGEGTIPCADHVLIKLLLQYLVCGSGTSGDQTGADQGVKQQNPVWQNAGVQCKTNEFGGDDQDIHPGFREQAAMRVLPEPT